MSLRKGARGARQGVSSNPDPVSLGIQYFSGMPFPLNHATNRVGGVLVFSAAYAVPFALNIPIRGGSPTVTGAPERAANPRRKRRRDNARCLVSTDAIVSPRREYHPP